MMPTTTFETIITRTEEGIGFLTLNRPHVLNALNRVLMREATEALTGFVSTPEVAAIVVNGVGRAFSAGFDLKEAANLNLTAIDQWHEHLHEDFEFIMQFWDCPKPTVAAVHGYCLAGAFEMALACDITVAAEGTMFGEPEARFGSGITCLLLPWMTGPKLAKELLLTGTDEVDANRALSMGIVNHVVPAGEELAKAIQLAQHMRAASPRSVQLTKRAINRSLASMGMREALLMGLDLETMIESGGGQEQTEFNKLRIDKGLKAALAWRDSRFK